MPGIEYFLQYESRTIPPKEYRNFLIEFSNLLDKNSAEYKYLFHGGIFPLFKHVTLNAPPCLDEELRDIYKKIRDLIRGFFS